MSTKGQRFFASVSLVALGLLAGVTITQLGSAIAIPAQQARPAVNTGSVDLDEAIPQGAFVRVAEETQQALVFIRAEQTVSGSGISDEFFRRFFDENDEAPEETPDTTVQPSQGSGFLISPSGYIVTNAHVVSRADTSAGEVVRAHNVMVRLSNEDEYDAEIVGIDIGTDLAVLKVEAGYELPHIPMGDSDGARVGEWVMALGAPFGLTNTVSAGIISAKGRGQIGGTDGSAYQDFIQTDAAINPGNSGGPLVNLRGEVIGINTAIVSNGFQGQFSGVGFAIPINLVTGVVDQLIEHGRTVRGWLGISMNPLAPALADAYGIERRDVRGAVNIATVNVSEPADMAGVEVFDIVVGTDGVPLRDNQDFLQRIGMTPPDETITLDILRVEPDDTPNGLTTHRASIEVMLGERPPEIDVLAERRQPGRPRVALGRASISEREPTPIEERLGALLSELDRNLASELEVRPDAGGIVVMRAGQSSPIAFPSGTIIQRVNLRPVNTLEEFAAIIESFEPGQVAVFEVRYTDGQRARWPIEIPQ